MKLILIGFIVLLFNIPFGYWRENVKKFSLQWALAIHIPIPFIVLLRIYSGIGFQFITYPVMIGVFFMGQLLGARIYRLRKKKNMPTISSCLVMDLIRSTDR